MVENAQLMYMYCYTSAYICKYDFLKYRIALPKVVRNINHFFHNSWNVILFFFFFFKMASFFQKPERNLWFFSEWKVCTVGNILIDAKLFIYSNVCIWVVSKKRARTKVPSFAQASFRCTFICQILVLKSCPQIPSKWHCGSRVPRSRR